MAADRWEMGSEFHWDEAYVASSSNPHDDLYSGTLFATARVAVEALAEHLEWHGKRLHLPTYFCPDVTESLAHIFEIHWYRDSPLALRPDFDSIKAAPGEIVLGVNYFGVRPVDAWSEWIALNPHVQVIEDYSHDPNPAMMGRSSAEYVLTSLRKTLPIPDGGLICSPRGSALPRALVPGNASSKLEAMALKSMYLRGLPVDKNLFRTLFIDGENHLASGAQIAASAFTASVLASLDGNRLRALRRNNVRRLVDSDVYGVRHEYYRPLFCDWSKEMTPFNFVVYARNMQARDSLRKYLIGKGIYPAMHWVQRGEYASVDRDAVELGDRLLTIPVDFRYDESDISRLIEDLDSFRM
jgi:hypothetical protein